MAPKEEGEDSEEAAEAKGGRVVATQ